MARQALGRGLSALLGDETPEEAIESGFLELDLELLVRNSEQPREVFEEPELEQLAQSIRANGVVQPIVVRPHEGSYQIVAGERRWRAAQKAGLKKIPAVVRAISDNKMLEVALIENIQRQELNPVEEARAYKRLIDEFSLTQEQVANRVGKTRPFVANYLRLLRLPKKVLAYLERGMLSVGHARALLAINGDTAMESLASEIISGDLSVRATEKAVKKLTRPSRSKIRLSDENLADPNVIRAETKLRRRYGTHVKIKKVGNGKKGRIELEFYNEADLDRIYNLLMGKD
ncbi:MAG: ParB/RepB/Spo0J family partition protein [Acidobacteria bacterium]|nr:MAG: ParB/RepB/Spo0J family partition protein [Acidobacteriota bacterium]REJ98391.1 MAG: ParB/RepB/Spo0J family partition protein [Acidobacteriota bacterium]REK17135.1 MAG: ParB/RepB/Spo0J family partition protein [Acidobacteriota bacterium]REK43045.1 MAG: ParB/RepB/Spo0J family partition protein [Acidobacteriota bacterium]